MHDTPQKNQIMMQKVNHPTSKPLSREFQEEKKPKGN